MSFSDDLTYLAGLLAADTGIAALFPGHTLKVVRRFQQRAEVHISDLPIIMMTRPRSASSPESNATGSTEHTVALYCGFNSEDRAAAQETIIKFEEAIEHAVMKDATLGNRVDYVQPGDSANDEGKYHPVYFFVKEIHISKETTWRP